MRHTLLYAIPFMWALVAAEVSADEIHSGGGEVFRPLGTTSVAFIRPDSPSADEEGAYATFRECYPQAPDALTCAEFSPQWCDENEIKAVWIHINRAGVAKGWENLPQEFIDSEFLAKLKAYSVSGGKMYLSGLATQLLVAVGRQPETYAPNIYFGDTSGSAVARLNAADPWGVTGKLSDADHDGAGSFGHAMHAIYGQTADNYPGYFAALTPADPKQNPPHLFSVLGPAEGETLDATDNNCMWQATDKNGFRRDNNAQVLGTWGQCAHDALECGIVEFVPDTDNGIAGHARFGTDTEPWLGNTIANGMACFQYANRESNIHYANLRNMTFNTINYLTEEYKEHVPSSVTEASPNQSASPAIWYDMMGIRVPYPVKGLYIMVSGDKRTKVMF